MKAIVTYREPGLSIHQTIELAFPLEASEGIHGTEIAWEDIISIDVKPCGEDVFEKEKEIGGKIAEAIAEWRKYLGDKKLYTREEMFEATFEAMKKAWKNEPIRPSMKEKFHGNWFDNKFPI